MSTCRKGVQEGHEETRNDKAPCPSFAILFIFPPMLQSCGMAHEVVPIEAALTVEAAAEKFHYHPESVRRAIRQGRIRGLRFGQGWRIPAPEVRRILATGLPPAETKTQSVTPIVRGRVTGKIGSAGCR